MAGNKLKVAICGGGVGGLTLAVALSRCSHIEVDIYEAAHQFAAIGAGIGMWPRAWKIMETLGLQEDLSAIAEVPPNNQPKLSFHFRKGDEPQGTTFQQLISPGGMISFHRPDFQSVLLSHLGRSCRTHTSKRLVSYKQHAPSARSSTGSIQLHFQDGTNASCDLLVGADGVRSTVRACMLQETASTLQRAGRAMEAQEVLRTVPAMWSGTMSYRATIPADVLRSRYPGHRVLTTPHVYLGTNSSVTAYPIARGKLINVAAFRSRYDLENTTLEGPWVQDVSRAEMLQDFDRWEPEVQALLACVQTCSRWALPTCLPLKTFASGRVVLLGDAAHAMMPYQGAGAGQAIEDALVLAALLAHPHGTRAPARVAAVYDAVRRPFAQRVAALSREAGMLYTLNFPGLAFPERRDRAQDAARLREIYERLVANWEWAWETTVDADVARAVAMLESGAAGS